MTGRLSSLPPPGGVYGFGVDMSAILGRIRVGATTSSIAAFAWDEPRRFATFLADDLALALSLAFLRFSEYLSGEV